MIGIIMFVILTVLETVIVWMKWNELQDMHEIAKTSSKLVNSTLYETMTDKLVSVIRKNKQIIVIPIVLILFVNIVCSLIFHVIWSIAVFLIN
jgi:hypothetical protein